ncbi:MAG: cytochrome C oxidase assembly protein [Rhodobacteraceae bacterium]|nr:cytochrome C oxidase assembly protein [Paracoccaceae bacterium]
MSFHPEHELHTRRKGRNSAVGLLLGGFVVLVFAVSIVKLSQPQSEDTHAPNYVTPSQVSE